MTTDGELAGNISLAGLDAALAALSARGAARFDPSRFHYLEALAARARRHDGLVRADLERRLAVAVGAFGRRFEAARREAAATVDRVREVMPDALVTIEPMLARGEFRQLRRAAARLGSVGSTVSLQDVVAHLHSANGEAASATGVPVADELKAVRHFRDTWSKISVERQVRQALAQGPENAGPLNSHFLVLRSLQLMHDLSPDYLQRFMSYTDALLCLTQLESAKPVSKKAPRKRTVRK